MAINNIKHSKDNSLKPAAILPDHHCLQLNPNISSRCISGIMHDNSLIEINKNFAKTEQEHDNDFLESGNKMHVFTRS